MPFIGNQPALSYTSFAKQDFTTSATTSYTLDNPVANANELALFINFVRQEPTTAYSASGTSLTLTSATSATDDMYCVYLGQALQTVNPANASVGSAQLSPIAITGQTAEATIADGDTILIHDASASALRKMTKANFVAGVGETNSPYFRAYMGGSNSLANNTTTKVVYDTVDWNVGGTYSTSDYRWTPGTQGKYFIVAQTNIKYAVSAGQRMDLYLRKNGSTVIYSRTRAGGDIDGSATCQVFGTVNLDSNDYVEIFALQTSSASRSYDQSQDGIFFEGFLIATY